MCARAAGQPSRRLLLSLLATGSTGSIDDITRMLTPPLKESVAMSGRLGADSNGVQHAGTLRSMTATPGEWRIHLGLILALAVCIPAFVIELARALGGNTLSWAYVFEWPLLAGYAFYMWRQLLRQERGVTTTSNKSDSPGDEAALAALNEYFDQVHRSPEGTPTPAPDQSN